MRQRIKEFLNHFHWSAQQAVLIIIFLSGILIGMNNFAAWTDGLSDSGMPAPGTGMIIWKAALCFVIAIVAIILVQKRATKYKEAQQEDKDGTD